MDNPVIICDLDGTLADYARGFVTWGLAGGCPHLFADCPTLDPALAHFRSLYQVPCWGVEPAEYACLLAEYAASPAFTYMPPIEGAVQSVREAIEQGATLLLVTARTEATQAATLAWLVENGIHYTGLLFDTQEERVTLAVQALGWRLGRVLLIDGHTCVELDECGGNPDKPVEIRRGFPANRPSGRAVF
jgi:hypothetical protein